MKRLALVLLLLAPALRADAIVRSQAMQAGTIAEFFVTKDGVRAELEIGLAELAAFRNLLPDELYAKLGDPAPPLAERLVTFFGKDLAIRPDDGEPLGGRIAWMGVRERIRRDEVTGEPLPDDGEPESVLFAVLEYPFAARPKRLSFHASAGNVGFVVYHGGLPVNDFRYLAGDCVLELDWDDPWYSAFTSRNLRRAYYAAMNGFLYVEPYEIRKEIIARPRDLQRWVDLGLAGRTTIPAAMQPELKRKVAEFLRGRHKVRIDGEEIVPELARIHFLRRTLRASTVIDPPEDLDVTSATLGVIFVYPTLGLPKRVTMDWDLFDDRIRTVPVAAVDQAGPLPSTLDPDDPVLEWVNFLKQPEIPQLLATETPPGLLARSAGWGRWVLAALALAALGLRRFVPGGLLVLLAAGAFWFAARTEPDRRAVVATLLRNVYHAFDFRAEEKIYDVLAQSVDGDLLTRLYLETRRGLELRNQGGARVKVKQVELVEIETEPEGDGFRARVTWNAAGSVGHWGHVHQRQNRYRADLRVQSVDGRWKLVAVDVLEEERV